MNLLDENIPSEQGDLLEGWGITCRIIGRDISELGVGDEEIITLLHRLKQPSFFTRDRHFFASTLCHSNYCLVWLDVSPVEDAFYIRRLLSHDRFNSNTKRKGKVIRVHPDGIQFWQRNRAKLQGAVWQEKLKQRA